MPRLVRRADPRIVVIGLTRTVVLVMICVGSAIEPSYTSFQGEKFMKNTLKNIALASVATIAFNANASVVTSLSGATAVIIPNTNQLGFSGPATFSGIAFSSSQPSAFGYTGGYGFSGNGEDWSGISMIGLDSAAGYFDLSFTNAISGFLAETNWTVSESSMNATAQAFDSAMNLLESVTFENGSNLLAPGYWGFNRSTDDISVIRFSNEYIGIRNISVVDFTSPVPEPETYGMLMAGLGLIGAFVRRRKQTAA